MEWQLRQYPHKARERNICISRSICIYTATETNSYRCIIHARPVCGAVNKPQRCTKNVEDDLEHVYKHCNSVQRFCCCCYATLQCLTKVEMTSFQTIYRLAIHMKTQGGLVKKSSILRLPKCWISLDKTQKQ